ncbi:MAG: arginine N-succinyltransferase [Planctomycetes bacterium]|nr:arginine N-succinyltransferase [Planctomycetota bacterium]
MHLIRPVREADLEGLLALAGHASFGLTTLPCDADWLAGRIRDSEEGFRRLGDGRPRGEAYLFVLEDTTTTRLVGTAGVISKVGGFEPFYAYHIRTTVHESTMLGVRKEIRTLHLVREHDGPCEIVSMFLHPDLRGRGAGRPLSLSRFLFIAEHPASFDATVIAEMRGVLDDAGRSEFWDAVGRHFFEIDYPKADYLSLLNKRFIADLMPRHPIYIPLLPPAAQAVIGRVHPETEPALAIVRGEGFESSGMVDIFEAGPIVRCPRDRLRLVRESARGPVAALVDRHAAGGDFLAGTTGIGFRACQTSLECLPDGGVVLPARTAEALGVGVGDVVRYGRLRGAVHD